MAKKRILVIEDDRSVGKLLEDALTKAGHEVKLETDGEWGLRTYEAKGADLVILDVLVPNMIGFDIVREIRKTQAGKGLPIIILSGVYSATGQKKKMVEEFDVVDYLDKPVDLNVLLPLVDKALSDGRLPPSLPPPPADDLSKDGQELIPNLSQLYRGRLEEISFAQLLGHAYGAHVTGSLMLRKSTIKKIVYLQQGTPVFVKSNLIEETLGRIMIKERLISPKENEASIARMQKERRKQGEILIEMGSISPHNLEFALERQMEVKLFDLFTWLEGKYLLNDETVPASTQVALSMSPAELIYEGVRRSMSPERIGRELSKVKDRIVIPSQDPTVRYQAQQLDPDAPKLLDAIDGRRTVGQILDKTPYDRTRASLLLYSLTSSCLLNLVDRQPAAGLVQRRLARLNSQASGSPSVQVVGEADIEPIGTGEVSADLPIAAAIRQAREKARAAAAAAHPRLFTEATEEEAEAEREAEEAELSGAEGTEGLEQAIESDAMIQTEPPVEAAPIPSAIEDAPKLETPLEEKTESADNEPAESNPSPEASSTAPADSYVLSDDVRAQIRARLEAEAQSFLSPPTDRPSAAPPSRPKRVPKPVLSAEAKGLLERERSRLTAELDHQVRALEKRNFYERLGLHRHSSPEEVKASYESKAREALERLPTKGAPLETQALAEELELLLRRSKNALLHPEERREYERSLGHAEDEEGIVKLRLAEAAFARGVHAMESGDWRQARGHFDDAVTYDPSEASYLAHRAWSTFHLHEDDAEQHARALSELDKAMEINPRLGQVYLFRGAVLERDGRIEEALESLRRALQYNPDNVQALRRLRALSPEPEKKGGLFGRFGSS